MKRTLAVSVAAALLTVGTHGVVHADAVTDCAAIQGKAFVAFFDALFKEAARACGKGSAGVPLAVSQAAVGALSGKLYAAVGKGVDKSGAASCYRTLETIATVTGPDDVLTSVRGLANAACLVAP